MINGIFGKKILDKKMKIFVIGSSGMLGRYVSTYLGQFYEVIKLSRKNFDISDVKESELEKVLIDHGIEESDVVINCAGTIKPRVDELGDLNALKVNSIFPRILSNICEKNKVRLIHPTTDCIYSGSKGNYIERDTTDVNDVYGLTKFLGEPKNCTVIRTSIIGEEVENGRSLVEWVKSEKNNKVFGFTNHYWNGITCLEFSKICKKIIDDNLYWEGIRHIHSNTVDKKQLVEMISEFYELNVDVTPKETEKKCDRSLGTEYNDNILLFDIPQLQEQIKEMVSFSETLYGNQKTKNKKEDI